MTVFLESPWPVLTIGIILEAILAILLLRTGQGKFLWGMIGAGVFVLAGLGLDYFVVTERELVEQTVDAGAAAVRANDLNAMLANISPAAKKTQSDARMVFNLAEFNRAGISELEVTSINRLTNPPTAKVKFLAVGAARSRTSAEFAGSFVYRLSVTMHKENGRWMFGDYTVEDFNMPKR